MAGVKSKIPVVRHYYNENKEVIMDWYQICDGKIRLPGLNQLHFEGVPLLPCGNPPKLYAGDIQDYENDCHKLVCDGVEHVTTCCIPDQTYLKICGTPCNYSCDVFLLRLRKNLEACFKSS